MLNQQVHIQTGNAQVRWNCQRRSQGSVNEFTHSLEMRKQHRIIRGMVSVQSRRSRVQTGNAQARWNC